MSSWTSGYIAEIGYTFGFYGELTPAVLAFAALARGQQAPEVQGPLAYCELGCGQGFTTNLLAAVNPQIEFHATDFNPSHIVRARALAAAAGTRNVHFHDRSFADFIHEPGLPAFDIIVLHGIYSWISPENRRCIVAFIARHLKAGGLVYISYNALPGWAAAIPLRRLFFDQAEAGTGPILARVEEAVRFAEQIQALDARYFTANPAIKGRLGLIKGQSRTYLAHEFFSQHWTPFFHADVVADLSDARLTWIGTAELLDHVDAFSLTADQQAMLSTLGDPMRREAIRDYIINRQFRRDVFIRGPVELPPATAVEHWLDLRLVLMRQRADVPASVTCLLGNANLQPEVFGPILAGLEQGPVTVAELMRDPLVADLGWARLRQAVIVLVGAGYVQPCLPAAGEAERSRSARAFNLAVCRQARISDDLGYLASPVTGGGIAVNRILQLLLLGIWEGRSDPVGFAWGALRDNGQRLTQNGTVLTTEAGNIAELATHYDAYETQYRRTFADLGIV
ncbi:MAG: hypothetical protein RLY86_1690 [Pseudomonadota bacterium]